MNPKEADLVLYLNYCKDGFVFTWAPNITLQSLLPQFYTNHVRVIQLPQDEKGIKLLSNLLLDMTNKLAIQKTGVWLNSQKKTGSLRCFQC